MTFNFPGYDIRFIQRTRCTDGSYHLFTYIYKFFSPVTDYYYIVRAEYHKCDTFAIKFYCKKDRKSEYKYSKVINKGDLGNIIMSCAKIIPLLLKSYPHASFCFAASRSVDVRNNTIEEFEQTQRFRLYQYMIPLKFGSVTFEHYSYAAISSYLLYNKTALVSKTDIEEVFKATYSNLSEINI